MGGDATSGCPFCLEQGLLADEPRFGNAGCYYLDSRDSVLRHAGMIIPRRHVATPFELNENEWRDTYLLLQQAKAHLQAARPDGFTIGWNVGEIAGQEVGHAHLHIIARFADEPLAGQGLRHHLKQPENRRPGALIR